MKSGCKLAYQKPKGRVTSTVREAVAVSQVGMMERDNVRPEGREEGPSWGMEGGQACPPADMSSCRDGDAQDGERPPEGSVWFEAGMSGSWG